MQSILRPFFIIGFFQILRAEAQGTLDSREVLGAASTRLDGRPGNSSSTKISPNGTSTNEERIRALAIALQNADEVLNGKRSRKNELSEKPRVFGSPIMAAELHHRSDDAPVDFGREKNRPRSRSFEPYSKPSSILLPPHQPFFSESDAKYPSHSSESVTDNHFRTNNSRNSSRVKPYEINSSESGSTERKGSSTYHNSAENSDRYGFAKNNGNNFGTAHRHSKKTPNSNRNSFSTYKYSETTTSQPLKFDLNRNGTRESAHERRFLTPEKYDNKNDITKKQDILSPEETGYHWGRRPIQAVNHYKFTDSSWKVGAIPGVPRQDYPILDNVGNNHLQFPGSRYICPTGPGTHIYLADRTSRCQVFYVCYGERTGVPMTCPNGTLFSEHLQVCDWWFNVSC